MGRFTKRLITGLAAVSMMAGGAWAQVSWLDDFRAGTNQNLFNDYWYFFDDNKEVSSIASEVSGTAGVGNSVVSSAVKRGTPPDHELLFDSDLSIDKSGGHDGNAAVLRFTFGQTFETGYDNTSPERARNPTFATCEEADIGADNSWKTGCYSFQQFVGIGTNLVTEGSTTGPKGIENATHISFYAKASDEMQVRFFVEQSHVEGNAHFGKLITIGTSWAPYEILLSEVDLEQPEWAVAHDRVATFDMTKAVKIAWQIQAADKNDPTQINPLPAAAAAWGEQSFWLDDIQFHGFEFVAADMCKECIVNSKPSDATVEVSNFVTNPVNWRSYYWYAYDDTKTATDDEQPGTSEIWGNCLDEDNEYAVEGVPLKLCAGEAPRYIEASFTMGRAMTIGGERVQPFGGLGTNLYDEEEVDDFFNAVDAEAFGLYFEYKTDGRKITFEVHDYYDVVDGADKRIESATWYIDIPGDTKGEWVSAVVPFGRLTQHTEWETVKENPGPALDKTRLAKFQFKYQGSTDEDVTLALRNVYLVGASAPIRHVGASAKTAGLRATYNRGSINVNWNAASQIKDGKVSLVNTKGRTVASSKIRNVSGNKVTASIGAGKIPTGMYFVRVTARDVNGKRIVQQAPVSIVK